MDGVLESTIALCGCKVLCSVLCLPAFKDSVSYVCTCCICLLLFTDLSITTFLVYLWSCAPTPASFQPHSDAVALRFVLFLSETYEAVVILTPLLVVVELLVRLLWGDKTASSATDRKEKEVASENEEDKIVSVKALGFLSCLTLWFVCGTYAGFSWRQEQERVRSCLERGSLFSSCLPCLVSATSPVSRELFWALPPTVLLLGLAALLLFLIERWRPTIRPGQMHPFANAEQDCVFSIKGAAIDCTALSLRNDERRCAGGKPEPPCSRAELHDSVMLVLLVHCAAPHPRESQLWQAATRESPRLRAELITGLLCGLLVCMFPTVLSTNVLLVSNLDALAVYAMKRLNSPPPLPVKPGVTSDACFHRTPPSEHS